MPMSGFAILPRVTHQRESLRRMKDSAWVNGWQPIGGHWGSATLLFQLSLFAIPAATAWTSTLSSTVWLPLIALPVTFVAGLVMLAFRGWRRVGAHVAVASVLAAALEVGLAFMLILAYSEQHPGWDLS
jgi:hypothetical protein